MLFFENETNFSLNYLENQVNLKILFKILFNYVKFQLLTAFFSLP